MTTVTGTPSMGRTRWAVLGPGVISGYFAHALRRSREVASPQDAVRSVGSEVALARRQSPTLGDRFVGVARALVDEFTLADGRRLYLIGDGRLVNLAAAEGHPAIVMDMSFANQALAAEWVVANGASLERRVYDVPKDIDDEIARLKLATMGVDIDQLTDAQRKYLDSWNEGTE